MTSKAQAGEALLEFINDFGIPREFVMDGRRDQAGNKSAMMQRIKKYDIKAKFCEPERHNQNQAESAVRQLKHKWYRIMVKNKVLKILWDYGVLWCTDIINHTANTVKVLHDRTPLEQVSGETPDVSEFLDFQFYN